MSVTAVGTQLKPTSPVAGLEGAAINNNNNSVKQKQLNDVAVSASKAQAANKVSDLIEIDSTVKGGKAPSPVALSPEQLEKVAQQLQDFVGEMNRGLEFTVDKDSGRDVIKVIDKNSGELVKQYPSEEVLNLVAKLSEMIGSFVDATV
jgi:flagellar protein FlaG